MGLFALWLPLTAFAAAATPDAVTVDGGHYFGPLVEGKLHGHGRIEWENGTRYEGQFAAGLISGRGEATYADGRKYRGDFVRGRWHGKGRLESPDGETFEGDFADDEFTGQGVQVRPDGSRYEGGFRNWRPHGNGRYTAATGDIFAGQFENGELKGAGSLVGKNGTRYDGEFRDWRFHGQGVLRQASGDVYEGGFADGVYEGPGTLTYARPRIDGPQKETGLWRHGKLVEAQRQAQLNLETALYNQRRLLDEALAAIAPRAPGRINLYLLTVAGDGAQEVFRREVEFVREQFDRGFGTAGRSLALINSRNTVATAPMATISSLRESLAQIAARMDKDEDILLLYLTSHGSPEFEFVLDQNGMNLRDLPAAELGELLKGSGIRWRVVLVSACYSGGFIDALKDPQTLVITAARHDRTSFGCEDDNDFTYFGRAFFREALPKSASFHEAFGIAETKIREWETRDLAAEGDIDAKKFSLPQIASAAPIEAHLRRWWQQIMPERNARQTAAAGSVPRP